MFWGRLSDVEVFTNKTFFVFVLNNCSVRSKCFVFGFCVFSIASNYYLHGKRHFEEERLYTHNRYAPRLHNENRQSLSSGPKVENDCLFRVI